MRAAAMLMLTTGIYCLADNPIQDRAQFEASKVCETLGLYMNESFSALGRAVVYAYLPKKESTFHDCKFDIHLITGNQETEGQAARTKSVVMMVTWEPSAAGSAAGAEKRELLCWTYLGLKALDSDTKGKVSVVLRKLEAYTQEDFKAHGAVFEKFATSDGSTLTVSGWNGLTSITLWNDGKASH